MSTYVQGSLFEKGYLLRTLGSIAHDNEVAITELVANSWDAGAASVYITIPDVTNGELRLRDDGAGMTNEQFKARWMRLGYDRHAHQGKAADFPPERATWKRVAYGRNGVGRHGLLCFADDYHVTTIRDGVASCFHVSTATENDPFVILDESTMESSDHGTELVAKVVRHLPEEAKLRQALAARFVHDPSFTIVVNGVTISRTEIDGNRISDASVTLPSGTAVTVACYDTVRAATNTLRQGVAFWVRGRLVGEPSWTLGRYAPVDGRTQFGKRYKFIVQCDGMSDEVLSDWTGFRAGPKLEELHLAVSKQVEKVYAEINASRTEETKETVYRQNAHKLQELPSGARLEVAGVIERVAEQNPGISEEVLESFATALLTEKKSTCMQSVLQKLVTLSETDIEGLDRFLADWDIKDALTVLDEVDNRIAVIEAIGRLSADEKADELHTLHPLVAEARWVFGPEFDTPEYASNLTIRNAVRKVFGVRCPAEAFENARKRSDLLIMEDATLSAVGLEAFDLDAQLTRTRDVLLIELKRGRFPIGRNEMTQADGYVQDIYGAVGGGSSVRIHAFVVGHEVAPLTEARKSLGNPVYGTVQAVRYSNLVDTASRRLFGLKQRLDERYGQLQKDAMPPSLRRALSHHQPELLLTESAPITTGAV